MAMQRMCDGCGEAIPAAFKYIEIVSGPDVGTILPMKATVEEFHERCVSIGEYVRSKLDVNCPVMISWKP